MAAHTDTAGSAHNGHHVAPIALYIGVFVALMVGTILTVIAARFDLDAMLGLPWVNNIVMLAIACTKALLVVLFFMHVRWSTRLTWVVAASGFFWLMILFVLTMSDYVSRGWMEGSLR